MLQRTDALAVLGITGSKFFRIMYVNVFLGAETLCITAPLLEKNVHTVYSLCN
jgi:hypothetical protein